MKKSALTLIIVVACSGLLFAQNKQTSKTATTTISSVKSTDINTQQLKQIDINTLINQQTLVEDIGYGYEKPKNQITSAVQTVNISDSQADGYNNIYDYLRGRVPGLVVTSSGDLLIRGTNSLQGGTNSALIVLNGIPESNASVISDLNPRDVKSVTVLKDASAASMYGTRGASGVIIIKTK